jgi:hypothetical protein
VAVVLKEGHGRLETQHLLGRPQRRKERWQVATFCDASTFFGQGMVGEAQVCTYKYIVVGGCQPQLVADFHPSSSHWFGDILHAG